MNRRQEKVNKPTTYLCEGEQVCLNGTYYVVNESQLVLDERNDLFLLECPALQICQVVTEYQLDPDAERPPQMNMQNYIQLQIKNDYQGNAFDWARDWNLFGSEKHFIEAIEKSPYGDLSVNIGEIQNNNNKIRKTK